MKRAIKIFGIVIYTVAIGLSIYWFNWKLAVIILLFLWALNAENFEKFS